MAEPDSKWVGVRAERWSSQGYTFSVARSADEIAQIQELLYRTFVVEVPRYEDPGHGYLVDRFHEQNCYYIARREAQVCGVMATHDQPPYSVVDALDDPAKLEAFGPDLVEARVFAIEPHARQGAVFVGLICTAFQHVHSAGHRYIVISGLAARQKMYEHLGFTTLGPAVLRGGDYFVPMVLDLSQLPRSAQQILSRWLARTTTDPPPPSDER
jgi:predicted GNAT family N-acyltransferase